MRRLLLVPALLLLSAPAAFAQTEQEVLDGIDTSLYCATAYAMATQMPEAPADKLPHYEEASQKLFEVAYAAMVASGFEQAKIDEVANAYSEEVAAAIHGGQDLRFTEEQCDAGYAAAIAG
jgi:hypothetical protein